MTKDFSHSKYPGGEIEHLDLPHELAAHYKREANFYRIIAFLMVLGMVLLSTILSV